MAALASSVDYDDITSDDLFHSLMNVALNEECTNYENSINNNDSFSSSTTRLVNENGTENLESTPPTDSDSLLAEEKETQKEPVMEVYPSYEPASPVKMIEPVYETCHFRKDANGAVTNENAAKPSILTQDKKDTKNITDVTKDPPNTANYTVEIVNSLPFNSEKLQDNTNYQHINVEGTTACNDQNIASLYAIPDKTKKSNNSTSIYAPVSVVPASVNGVVLEPAYDKSEYAEVFIKEPTKAPGSSDYEVVSNLQLTTEVKNENESKLNRFSIVFDAKQIAFGNQQLQNSSERQMYNSIQNTIDHGSDNPIPSRSAHSSAKEKKHFFGFGKKHTDHSNTPTRASSERREHTDVPHRNSSPVFRRQNSVLVVTSGYMFKQGGTGFTPKNWRLRWFELKKDNCLYYYKSEQDHIANGAVMLLKYTVLRAPEVNKRFGFKLVKGGTRTYYFAANSEEEMRKWMKNLGEAAKNAVHDHTSIPECSLKNVSIPALSISEPDCHGYIHKQGDSHKSWKRRYCVLKYGCLFYYEDMSDGVAIGVFKLHHYTITTSASLKFGFDAIPPLKKMRTYHFYVDSEIDFKRWLEAMKYSIASFKG